MTGPPGAAPRLQHLAAVVLREAALLLATDRRLFGPGFGTAQVLALAANEDLAERVDAFVARFGRLQDTLSAALLPRLLHGRPQPMRWRAGWVRCWHQRQPAPRP